MTKTQSVDFLFFKEALKSTATHRETSHIFNDISKRIDEIENSETLKNRWNKYTKDYRYAEGIIYDDIIEALRKLTFCEDCREYNEYQIRELDRIKEIKGVAGHFK